jgi:two-component system sensor histidine kinase YesM
MNNRLSLKKQLILLVAMMALAIGMLIAVSVSSYYEIQYQLLVNSHDNSVAAALKAIEANCRSVSKLMNNLAYNQDLQTYMGETDPRALRDLNKSLSALFVNTQNVEEYLLDIAAVSLSNGNFVNLVGDISFFAGLMGQMPPAEHSVYYFGRRDFHIQTNTVPSIVACRWIYSLDLKDPSPCGAILLALNPEKFLNAHFQNGGLPYALFLEAGGGLVCGDGALYAEYQAAGASPGFPYKYQSTPIGGTPYTLVSFVPKQFQNQIFRMMLARFVPTMAVILAALALILLFITRFFSILRRLALVMNKITWDNRAIKERMPVETSAFASAEADSLITSFNAMLDEIDRLHRENLQTHSRMYQAEIYGQNARLAFLRSQINPHFMYNTLALICGMSTEHKTDEIVEIAQAIAKILRYSVKEGDFVKFYEELDIVKSYIMIQSYRFEERFTAEYSVVEDVQQAVIPKMILQPLAENAIVHGLENSERKGNLQVGACRDATGAYMILWVYDTGVGMSEEALAKLRAAVYGDAEPTGIGLRNVNDRIRLYYGEKYRLAIDSEEGAGTSIQLKIPLQF